MIERDCKIEIKFKRIIIDLYMSEEKERESYSANFKKIRLNFSREHLCAVLRKSLTAVIILVHMSPKYEKMINECKKNIKYPFSVHLS